ncbi:hypothetical protein CBF23_006130 [Marinomonas agarivorans]|nr:hypothetical protein CBF23_006130 [Marinomonas agarivorans]
MNSNIKIILALFAVAVAASVVYNTVSQQSGAVTDFVGSQLNQSEAEAEQQTSPLTDSKQLFYFNHPQEQLWVLKDPTIDSNIVDINIYSPSTGQLINSLQLDGFDWFDREVALWGDKLWVVSPKNSSLAIINIHNLTVERDPKIVNTLVPELTDKVFAVTGASPYAISVTLESGETRTVNPIYQIAEKGQIDYKRRVSDAKEAQRNSNSDYSFTLEGNDKRKQAILASPYRTVKGKVDERGRLVKERDVLVEGEHYFYSSILFQNAEFAIIRHKETLDYNSKALLTRLNKKGETWTVPLPEGAKGRSYDNYEIFSVSDEKIVVGYQSTVNPIVFAVDTQTGANIWTVN